MVEITKNQFKQMYVDDLIYELTPIIDGQIYAKVKAELHFQYGKVVWCTV